jgi:hypothetical protein
MSVQVTQQQQQQQSIMTQKKKIVVPPTQYPLQHLYQDEVFEQIGILVSTGSINTQKGKETSNIFLKTIREQPRETLWIFGYIPAPPHEIITKRVIGIDGYFFKMTTTLCGVNFIWHDRLANMFLFWGASKHNVIRAMNSIRWRIQKCYEMPPPPPQRATSQRATPRSEYTIEDISDNECDDTISIGRVPDVENSKIE